MGRDLDQNNCFYTALLQACKKNDLSLSNANVYRSWSQMSRGEVKNVQDDTVFTVTDVSMYREVKYQSDDSRAYELYSLVIHTGVYMASGGEGVCGSLFPISSLSVNHLCLGVLHIPMSYCLHNVVDIYCIAGLDIINTNIIDISYLYFGLILGCIDADLCK